MARDSAPHDPSKPLSNPTLPVASPGLITSVANPDNALLPKTILRDEHAQLRRRREQCFPAGHPHLDDPGAVAMPSPNEPATKPPTEPPTEPEAKPATESADAVDRGVLRSTVGLALSGGGIRSASFNLGILEAFQRHGLIRWVDYLSTVSGGGFIGAYFGTKLCDAARSGPTSKPADDSQPRVRTFELRPQAGKVKPHDAGEFIRGGTFLKDKAQVTERFLIGFVLNLAVFGSFAVAVAAWVAWLWRWFDWPAHCYWVADYLHLLTQWANESFASWQFVRDSIFNFYKDWFRPFVPAIFFGTIWLVLWLWSYFFRYTQRFVFPRPFGSWPFYLFAGSVAIGIATFLSTDDVVLTNLPVISRVAPESTSFKSIGWQVTILLLAGLLPYLNPWKLLRSEPRAPGKLEKSLLNFGGTILLFLAPFALLFYFSQEDISGAARDRDPKILHVDIQKAPTFLLIDILESPGALGEDLRKALLPRTLPQVVDALTDADTYLETDRDGIVNSMSARDREFFRLCYGELDFLHNTPLGDIGCTLNNYAYQIKSHSDGACWEIDVDVDSKDNRPSVISKLVSTLRPLGDDISKLPDSHKLKVNLTIAQAIASAWIVDETPEGQAFSRAIIEAVKSAADKKQDAWVELEARIYNLRDGERFFQQLWPRIVGVGGLTPSERAEAARVILEGLFRSHMKERSVAGVMLTWRADQNTRWNWAVGATAMFFVCGLFVNMNATSIHGFYRRKIAECFVAHPDQGESGFNVHAPADLLSHLDTVQHGGPYHLFSATLNLFNQMPWKLSEYSSAYTFTFSPRWCGAQPLAGADRRRLGYRRTGVYCGGQLDIPTVVAVSGAAFSPTVFRSPLLFFMSMLFNVRLGQWMPNPARSRNMRRAWYLLPKRLRQYVVRHQRGRRCVTMLQILFDACWTLRRPEKATEWQSLFISDGGHNDNLGISPLLFRRCRLIIISDATGDPSYRFSDLMKTIRRSRLRSSIIFRFHDGMESDGYGETANSGSGQHCGNGLAALRPRDGHDDDSVIASWTKALLRQTRAASDDGTRNIDELPVSARHAILLEIEYPEKNAPKGYVLYIKSSMTGDEPADLRQWQADNPAFPHDPTTDQFFTENQVESYRQLGEHIGNELCQAIANSLKARESAAESHGAASSKPRSTRRPGASMSNVGPLDAARSSESESAVMERAADSVAPQVSDRNPRSDADSEVKSKAKGEATGEAEDEARGEAEGDSVSGFDSFDVLAGESRFQAAVAQLSQVGDPLEIVDDAVKILAEAFHTDAGKREQIELVLRRKIAASATPELRGQWQGLLTKQLPGMIPADDNRPAGDRRQSGPSSTFPLWDWDGPIDDVLAAIQHALRPPASATSPRPTPSPQSVP